MEPHDLAWWKSELGLDSDAWHSLKANIEKVKDSKTPVAKRIRAWGEIFDTLGVNDSLDGFARMESFIGGVFSSELAPELEGCLYAGGMSVGGYSGFMWKSDGLLRRAWVYLVDRGGNGQRGEQGAYRGQSLLLPTLTRSSASAEAEVLPLPYYISFSS